MDSKYSDSPEMRAVETDRSRAGEWTQVALGDTTSSHLRVCQAKDTITLLAAVPQQYLTLPAACCASWWRGVHPSCRGSKQKSWFTLQRGTDWKCWLKCCFMSIETLGLLGTGAQDSHLDCHTVPELWLEIKCTVHFNPFDDPKTAYDVTGKVLSTCFSIGCCTTSCLNSCFAHTLITTKLSKAAFSLSLSLSSLTFCEASCT